MTRKLGKNAIALLFFLLERNFAGKVCKRNDNNPCRCELKNGSGIIDLTSLGQSVLKPPDFYPWIFASPSAYGENDGLFSYNPCLPFNVTGIAADLAVFADPPGSIYNDIGQQSSATFQITQGQLYIKYTSKNEQYSSLVRLICVDKTTDFMHDGTKEKEFYFHIRGYGACPVPNGNNKGDISLSPQALLIIIIVVLLACYLLIGLIWKYKHGERFGNIETSEEEEGLNPQNIDDENPSTSCLTRVRNLTISKYNVLDDTHEYVKPTGYGSFNEPNKTQSNTKQRNNSI